MRARGVAVGLAVLGLSILPLNGSAAAPADEGSRVCTWGGTPAAPTGTFTISPGVTNFPSAGPLQFSATGPLAGDGPCAGTMTFRGIVDAGGTCSALVFEGKVEGLPGVASFYGPGALGLVHEFLYDNRGDIVGSDQPQVLTVGNATDPQHPAFTACETPEGITEGSFSSTVELYPSYGTGLS